MQVELDVDGARKFMKLSTPWRTSTTSRTSTRNADMSPKKSLGRQLGRGPVTLRVLGVDPGLTRCGLGVVDVEPNRQATMVAVGVVGTSPEQSLDARLLVIANVHRRVAGPAPAATSWPSNGSFPRLNVSTVMGVAQASGVVIAAAARRGIPVALHTPSEVKAAVTGSGRADKDAVTKWSRRSSAWTSPPRPADAADALALAIAHAWRRGPLLAAPARQARHRRRRRGRPSGDARRSRTEAVARRGGQGASRTMKIRSQLALVRGVTADCRFGWVAYS